jgi:hypothetical protein
VLYLLLIGLFALPLIGATIAMFTRSLLRAQTYQTLAITLTALLALLIAWVLRPLQLEVIFGNWSPISFTGAPLILATNPEGLAVIATIASLLALSGLRHIVEPSQTQAVGAASVRFGGPDIITALLFSALTLTALANNLLTLIVGLGLVDILATVNGVLVTRDAGRVLRDALFYGASGVLLLIAVALYGTANNSLYFPLAHIPERLMPIITVALALRFCLIPLRAAADLQRAPYWPSYASAVAGMLVLIRLPQLEAPPLRAWFFGLALLTTIVTLALGVLSRRYTSLRAYATVGALGMALTAASTWQDGTIVAATIVWLLGITLVNQSRVTWRQVQTDTTSDATHAQMTVIQRGVQIARIIGAACLLGFPLTIGFAGYAGVIAAWAGRGLGGAALIVGFTLAHILLTMCVLHLVTWRDTPASDEYPSALAYLFLFVLAVMCLQIIVLGIDPALIKAPTLGALVGSNGVGGWLLWLAASALGFMAWRFESDWMSRVAKIRPRLISILNLNWLQSVITGALERLARPLASVFVFFESDGALLWAVIVILIVILVSRPGGP